MTPSADPIETRLHAMGLALPAPLQVPEGARLPFVGLRVIGRRAYLSGHGPLDADGKITGPFGKVGHGTSAQVSPAEANLAAQRTVLAMLATVKQQLGNLDRIAQWGKLFGMVNAAPGFTEMPAVINGASDLLLALYGPVRGAHARSAIGVAELPWNIPVEIEGELELDTLEHDV
jgi:enamine deaminase RidA (YjgF/YER057c/UK114 family)